MSQEQKSAPNSSHNYPHFAEQGWNCGAKKNGPHRCGPHVAWLPDLGSNQGPAD